MHREEMSHWLWTSVAWVRDKCGSMDKALADIGWLMPKANVVVAVIQEDTEPPSANMVVVNLLRDGNILRMTCTTELNMLSYIFSPVLLEFWVLSGIMSPGLG